MLQLHLLFDFVVEREILNISRMMASKSQTNGAQHGAKLSTYLAKSTMVSFQIEKIPGFRYNIPMNKRKYTSNLQHGGALLEDMRLLRYAAAGNIYRIEFPAQSWQEMADVIVRRTV